MGEAENDLVMHGKAIKQGQGESLALKSVQRYQTSDLYLFFGEYKLAADSALERGEEFNEVHSGSALVMIENICQRDIRLPYLPWPARQRNPNTQNQLIVFGERSQDGSRMDFLMSIIMTPFYRQNTLLCGGERRKQNTNTKRQSRWQQEPAICTMLLYSMNGSPTLCKAILGMRRKLLIG
mmetsp:Transcript_30744/g.73786  ORF Transcript_30744/g.73786 Transcript_30744/m.73786 type:complete len:181 (-) Transcript_30744:345-887(-)